MYEPGSPDWVRDPIINGGGYIIDHTVHAADMIRWLTGSEYNDVYAMSANTLRDIPAEDIAVMHGQMTDGTLYQIDASWSRKPADPCWGDFTMRVVGTEGSAMFDLYNSQMHQVYTNDGVELRYCNQIIPDHAGIFLDFRNELVSGQRGQGADEIDGVNSTMFAFGAYSSVREKRCVNLSEFNTA